MRLITPPLPAASRPSNSTTTLSFWCDHPVLQLDQLALQPEQLAEIALAVDVSCCGVSVDARRQPRQPVVVELQLELLVEAVLELGLDAVLEALLVAVGIGFCGIHRHAPRLAVRRRAAT